MKINQLSKHFQSWSCLVIAILSLGLTCGVDPAGIHMLEITLLIFQNFMI